MKITITEHEHRQVTRETYIEGQHLPAVVKRVPTGREWDVEIPLDDLAREGSKLRDEIISSVQWAADYIAHRLTNR